LTLAGTARAQTPAPLSSQSETQELPSVTVGPPPASKRPSVIKVPTDSAGAASIAAQPPKTLQLRLDPKTGKALTDAQLRERARRPVQAPRSLRPLRSSQPETSAAAAAATVPASGSDSATDSEKKLETDTAGTDGIQVKALGQAKVSAIGLLNEMEGGFGSAMWAGTPKALVMELLPRLPMYTTSPTMQSLRRRLLISTALPPIDDGGDRVGGDGRALVALRIARLAAAGDSEAVAQLLKFAPLSMDNAVFAQVRVEAELLAGNVREACRITRNRLGADTGQDTAGAAIGAAIAWQKIMAFCLALDGQTAQAELYEQLLYENGVEDEAFFTLLAGLNSSEAEPLERIARTEPLHLAMLRAARRAIPADAVKQASPVVLRAIATSPNATLPMRLEAAERAEAMATLETDVLARVYASVPFSAEQNADALALAKQEPGPSASAILYQVAQIDAQVESRARALAAAWRNGRRSGSYMTSVRVNLAGLVRRCRRARPVGGGRSQGRAGVVDGGAGTGPRRPDRCRRRHAGPDALDVYRGRRPGRPGPGACYGKSFVRLVAGRGCKWRRGQVPTRPTAIRFVDGSGTGSVGKLVATNIRGAGQGYFAGLARVVDGVGAGGGGRSKGRSRIAISVAFGR
jgi:hypothetical protein